MSSVDEIKVNPMDWYNTKFLTYIPEHFVRVKFHHPDSRPQVLDWLRQNTVGRFAIEVVTDPDSENKRSWMVNEEYQIGFENSSEATMYTMFFR